MQIHDMNIYLHGRYDFKHIPFSPLYLSRLTAAEMAPVPGVHRDAPEKSVGDADTVDDEDIPTFIIPVDNSSDSDDGEEDIYGGYQLLPQDPDYQGTSSGLSGSAVTPGGDVGTPELDDVIMSVLDAGDCPYTTAASYGEVSNLLIYEEMNRGSVVCI